MFNEIYCKIPSFVYYVVYLIFKKPFQRNKGMINVLYYD